MLEECLFPTVENNFNDTDEWIFQQDNAPCHTVSSIKQFFSDNGIECLQWPARSPDLNPIENVWAWIDRKLTIEPCTSKDALKSQLAAIYETITTEYCKQLYGSIKKRAKLVIKNKGGHIPY